MFEENEWEKSSFQYRVISMQSLLVDCFNLQNVTMTRKAGFKFATVSEAWSRYVGSHGYGDCDTWTQY